MVSKHSCPAIARRRLRRIDYATVYLAVRRCCSGVFRGRQRRTISERQAEVEVGEGGRCKCLDEDVDDDVRVVEVWVKLIAIMESKRDEYREEYDDFQHAQLQDGKVSQTVIFLASNLVV